MDKAQAALNLIRDDFFVGEITTMKQECINKIVNSRPDDYDIREDAYRTIKTLDAVMAHFESIADSKRIEQKRWKIL